MKKSILFCSFTSLLLGITSFAQVTAVGNATVAPYRFVGWDGTGPGGAKDLDIRNNWNRPINFFTNNTQKATLFSTIGLGAPAAAFHINANLLSDPLPTANNTFRNGEVFRTSSNATGTDFNAWRMFTGAGNGLERFNISNLAGTNNIQLGSVQNGSLSFATNNTQRITVTSNGLVALGLNFTNPIGVLHVNGNGYNSGNVFYTSGPATSLNAWRLQTGPGNGTEKFRFNNPHQPTCLAQEDFQNLRRKTL